ncbi:MAG: DEAD/DEAH box helicase family protein [Bdellovibrionales bacterium]|nr:DEAD/DEAH box helicase family protein [Bdellovibrionales bacterium]
MPSLRILAFFSAAIILGSFGHWFEARASSSNSKSCRLFVTDSARPEESTLPYNGLSQWLSKEPLFSGLPWTVTSEGISLKGLVIQSTEDVEARLVISPELKRLYWPSRGLTDGVSAGDIILQALVGTQFHPYNSTASGPKILKDSQKEAVAVIESFRNRGRDRILLVAPPGFGKTEVAVEFLSKSRSASGLRLIIADRVLNLRDFSESLNLKGIPHGLWSAKSQEPPNLRAAVPESMSGEKYVVTTTATLRNQFKSLNEKERGELARVLKVMVYDESQHLGAPLMREFLEDISARDDFSGFILGLTATPVHRDISLQEMFYNQSYWVHLDRADNVMNQTEFLERNVSDVVEQLYRTFSKGELTPFDQLFFLSKEIFEIEDLFVQGLDNLDVPGGRYVINPKHYEYIARFLKSLIQEKNKILIVANSIEEAESLSKVFKNIFSDFFVDFIHSKQEMDANLEILENFKKSQKGIIVSVRMLDEGVNLSDLDLLIDLNSSASVTQFLQRLGRLLRLREGKTWVEAVSLVVINEETASELLILMNELKNISQPRSNGRRQLERIFPAVSTVGFNQDILAKVSWGRLESSIQQFWQKSRNKWRSFEAAREWARGSGIQSSIEWNKASKKGLLPVDIPSSPRDVYSGEFQGWGDWLSTGSHSRWGMQWRTFEGAREWARESGIKSSTEWIKASKEGLLPQDIPSNPGSVYRSQFQGWKDWLGTGWRSFEEAREWARGSGIKSSSEWRKASTEGRLPEDIPSIPSRVYREDFKNWKEWLGTGRRSPRWDIQWRSFEAAREWARGSGIKSGPEWIKASKEGLLPQDIPTGPRNVYPGEFHGWEDWLGTGWRSFEAAREWARGSGIKSYFEWIKASKKGLLPEDIPSNLNKVYRGQFQGWKDWLGTGWRSFEAAREWARGSGIKSSSEWRKASTEGQLPQDIPSKPKDVYRGQFQGWKDWLGKEIK